MLPENTPPAAPRQTQDSGTEAQADTRSTAPASSAPSISLPKGGGAIRGIGEKFAANPVIGTGSLQTAIKKMQQRQKDKPKSTRKDYKCISRLVAWVSPNTGSGNRRSHPLKAKTH